MGAWSPYLVGTLIVLGLFIIEQLAA